MSITIKSKSELAIMREAGRITCGALWYAGERLKPGMSTLEVDRLIGDFFAKHGCKSGFKGLYGFPANACISVNEEVIHGIPKASRRLKEGDIVSIDTGAVYKGFNGDSCWTFPVGKISDEA
ncbi:MAG: M24 family metallopeptidase, partial [Ruminococcus sp.]|nr:M24 family metallopeptidase [Ruminococcus sp.]